MALVQTVFPTTPHRASPYVADNVVGNESPAVPGLLAHTVIFGWGNAD